MISLMLKHRLQRGGGPYFLIQNEYQSPILNGETTEILTIVDDIIHFIYATFYVDLMYDTDEPEGVKICHFSYFLAEKVRYFR